MRCCKLRYVALIIALAASHHFVLIHAQQSPSNPKEEEKNHPTFAILIGVLIGLVLMIGLLWWYCCRRSSASNEPPLPITRPKVVLEMELPHALRKFTYEQLRSATSGFSNSQIHGKDGFGTVYKGVHTPENEIVAIKKLKPEATKGQQEFLTEVSAISKGHHRHIVSLLGYCIDKGAKMLVYESMPNDSLHSHLHDPAANTLDWKIRMKIAIDSARVLKYIHEDCDPAIIHGNISSQNILLLDDFQPKIANVGLAKLLSDAELRTILSQRTAYLAPEYAESLKSDESLKISEKSDVFAFGAVLWEIIRGKKWSANWAEELFVLLKNKDHKNLADKRLQSKYDPNEMVRMISCAEHCLRPSANDRPQMSKVVEALQGNIRL